MSPGQRLKPCAFYILILLSIVSFSGCDDNIDTLITREQEKHRNNENPDDPVVGTGTWNMLGDSGVSLRGAAFAVRDGWAYVHGGSSGLGVRNELWRFSLSTAQIELLDSGTAREKHGMAFVGDVLYVFGGLDALGEPSRALLYYDMSIIGQPGWTGTIEINDTNGPFPTARYGHSVLGSGNYLYVYGGMADSAADDRLYRFDPNDLPRPRWSIAALDGPEVAGHGSAVSGDYLYVFGGTYLADGEDQFSDEMWAYGFSSEEWALLGTLAAGPRAWIGLAEAGGSLYTCFGLNGGTLLEDAWEYSPGPAWAVLNEGPPPRSGYCMASANGAFVLYGGYDPSLKKYYSDIWLFSPGD